MSQKIPKEKLQDLLERSSCGIMDDSQCAIWLPEVCAYALELVREEEHRERMMTLIKKVEDYRKDNKR